MLSIAIFYFQHLTDHIEMTTVEMLWSFLLPSESSIRAAKEPSQKTPKLGAISKIALLQLQVSFTPETSVALHHARLAGRGRGG